MSKEIDKLVEEFRRQRSIVCPYCEESHSLDSDSEIFEGLITYHGEEAPQEFTCQTCDRTFFVKEHVARTFEEKKTREEFE